MFCLSLEIKKRFLYVFQGHTPRDLVIIKDKDSEEEKIKKTEMRDFLKVDMVVIKITFTNYK